MSLRKKLGVEGEPEFSPVFRFLQLGAFWQHWNLHRRKCDKTGNEIISVFSPDCPYPVWHKDEWIKNANPPGADFNETKEMFPQMWEFFQKSPIAHNVGTRNENCEYTDDWWYSKNCYLCHSGYQCEDLRYCYRTIGVTDCQYCVFTRDSELCVDVVNSSNCFSVLYALSCRQCRDSAFLYDCRGCSDCFFCWNLRNKQYCFQNEQLTKEEYEKKRREWDLHSRRVYEQMKEKFRDTLKEKAWHRALSIEHSENSTGDYLDECKNCENCYLVTIDVEDCINVIRSGVKVKDCLDIIGSAFNTEFTYYTSLAQDQCYDDKFGYNLTQCKWTEYCAHCFHCEYCFGCCGLVRKQYHIFNKPYSPEEYEQTRKRIINKMKKTGEYGNFFPGYFAAHPYDESWSSFYWPLTKEQQKKFGFRVRKHEKRRESNYLSPAEIPDRSDKVDDLLIQKVFWDSEIQRPFQIQKADILFAQKVGIPLPNIFYIHRIQENFRWIPFNGKTRTVKCGKCDTATQTSWPSEYDGRILCEECYLKEVY